MILGEKLRLLRSLEGNLRGLGRPLAKSELAKLLMDEQGETLSQAYLSQLESGKRTHLTAKSRTLLAAFFKVHPGYLVSDPEDYSSEPSTGPLLENRLDGWLEAAAQDLEREDAEIASALRDLAASADTRGALLLLGRLASQPELVRRLQGALGGGPGANGTGSASEGAMLGHGRPPPGQAPQGEPPSVWATPSPAHGAGLNTRPALTEAPSEHPDPDPPRRRES